MTIAALLQLYQDHHLAGKVSAPYYARIVRTLFGPLLACEVDQVPLDVLLNWWKSLWVHPGNANKAIGLLRASHRWAVGLGAVTTPDQTAGLTKRTEQERSQTTSPHEWASLAPHLENLKLRHRIYFWALYLSGSRPGEVRTLKPEYLRLDDEIPCWVIPTSKNGRPHVKPISRELVPLFRLLMISNPPNAIYLFWGAHPGRVWGRTSAQKMWEGLRERAGLKHLWMNDLRRSTASDLLNQGESLGVVQGALNHRSLSQTAKYAYLAVKSLSIALQKRTDTILAERA